MIRGSHLKIPLTDPELTSCPTTNQLAAALEAPEQPHFQDCWGAGTRREGTVSVRVRAAIRDTGLLLPPAPLPAPSLVQQTPHLWKQLSFSQFAPKDPNPQGSVAQVLLIAGSVNSLVCAKLLVVCRLRPACDFPQRCFRNL